MFKKKVLNFMLNVNHTVTDDVKIFDDGSIVFYVHPTKGKQCRCNIFGRKDHYYDERRDIWLETVANNEYRSSQS